MFFKKKTYDVQVECHNCDANTSVEIPKGVEIDKHLEDEKGLCPNCGCPISLQYQKQLEEERNSNE